MSSASSASSAHSAASNSGTDTTKRLLITHVDAFGPYLRIYGQMNPDAMAAVRNKIQEILRTCLAIDPTWPVQRQQVPLRVGTMCLYKSIKSNAPADFEFLRVRILDVFINSAQNATPGQEQLVKVEVEFADYGGKALVASYELFFPKQPEALSSMPTLCAPYIVLGICKDFKSEELEEISRIIIHQSLEISIEYEFKQYKFITMKWKEFNFAEFLIHQKKIGAPIANDLLRDNFAKFVKQQNKKQQQQQQQQQNQQSQQKQQAKQTTPTLIVPQQQQQQTHHLAIAQRQQQQLHIYPAAVGNANNNHYYGINHNNNVTPVSGIYPAVGRSLASRLQQCQLQQQHQPPSAHLAMPAHMMMNIQRPIQPRMPHTIGNLRSLYVPYVASNYQQHTPYNGFQTNVIVSTPVTATMPGVPPYTNTYNTRYLRPQPMLQPQQQQSPEKDSPNSSIVLTSPRRATTATFKTNNLTIGKTYDVYVSFVENGPCLFSVQLAMAQDELTKMMNRIEHVELKQYSDKPVLGTACIARYSEDGQLYRALITGVQTTACKVVYIDYGNAELVKYNDLYEIPDEFLEARAFAIRFTLSGHKELEPIDESLKKAFKDLMMYKNCQLKVMPLEGPPLVQYCELYLQKSNVLDVMKEIQKCRLVYPKSENLKNNDIVEIRYIDSPKHFYVQKVDNIAKFEKLMDDMFLYYNKNQVVPNHLALGSPCIVKFENEWYRAEVMRADTTAIIVRHVDFGYEQKVTKNLLSTIAEKHLKLPRQAIQCCLKGFENNELSKDLATNQFEMLAEESNRQRRSFTVKVFRIQPDGVHLVNLCTKELNVMKKLYKLSMPFEQYLILEKEEFIVQPQGAHHTRLSGGHENGNKTPSIASSNDVASMHSSKKAAQMRKSNSPHISEHMQPKTQQQQQSQQPLQPRKQTNSRNTNSKVISSVAGNVQGNSNIQGTLSVDWDKHSSASSMDNRDSRSSSSEIRHGKRQQQSQNQLRQGGRGVQQHLNMSNSSSAGSNVSGFNHKRGEANQIPPRFQKENRRQKKEQQVAPQSRQQRPQNAPQGYSQQRDKTAATSSASSSNAASQRASDVASDVGSNASEFNEQAPQIQQQQQQQEPPTAQVTDEYVPLTQAFPVQHLDTPSREEVIICWWISPHQFYTHLKSRLPEFERFMREIQMFYKKKSLQQLQLKVGSYVIARYRKENLLYRARILACNQMLRKYKVQFVDIGNQYTVTSEDIWQVEKRFASLPVMAHLCSFSGIISNYDHLYIIDRMDKYLPAGAILHCEYIEREQEMYYVNVKLNGISLKETLKSEGIITEVAPELRLSLLAGQQIRVKITYVKDMLNFKILIDGFAGNVHLLCSYDDVRYVKSNPDIAIKFKSFYEGKSCVVNIKDVNDNKVILLRPLVPLLKDDVATFICQQPVVLESFEARVVHVASAYRVFVHTSALVDKMTELLNEMYEYYENNGTPLESLEPDRICAAQGSDGNWYRARITPQITNNIVEVHYIDYGNTEKLTENKLKELEEKFYIDINSYAIELNLPVRTLTADAQHKSAKSKKPLNIAADAETAAMAKLKELTFVDEPVLRVMALEVQRNHLIGELILPSGENVVDTLLKSQLIKARDVDFMRKQLEKDGTNMYEYIEMVDLTLEEEDDVEKKPTGKSKNSASPKKKKQPKSDECAEKTMKKDNVISKMPELKKTKVSENPVDGQSSAITADTPPQTPAQSPLDSQEVTAAGTEPPTPAPAPPAIPPPPAPTSSEPQSVAESETESIDPYVDMEHAMLGHCDNPGQFYLHPYHKMDELNKLQEDLQIISSSLPSLMVVANGAHCISYYSVNKQWYRAKIIDAELMVLQFIDYGNTDCVSDTTHVREMSCCNDIEPFCMPCSLPIKPNGTADWVDAANAIFSDSHGKMVSFEYITHGEKNKRSFINLYIDGVNVAERLVEDGFAKHLELVDSGENCYISHVNNINDFYIQYEKDSKALELIEIYLAEYKKLRKLEKFERDKIVAALFPEDEMWYRAKLIKQVPNQSYEVLFIDYGNTSISPECREISDEIAKLPPLSKKCGLELPDHCLVWSEAAEEKFSEIAAQGETIFTVELREPAVNHALVHLLIDGHNINDDLEPLCEHKPIEVDLNVSFNTTIQSSIFESGKVYDAVISHANSPIDFYVQFSKDSVRLDDMTKSMNSLGMDALKNVEVGQLCAALYSEDEVLYRARILEIIDAESDGRQQYRVVFVDFGNAAITDDVRVLPHDLQALPEFAKHCQLAGFAEEIAEEIAQVAVEAFGQLVDECEGQVKIEFMESREGNMPVDVKLYASSGGEDLGERLYAIIESMSRNGTAVMGGTSQIADNTCVISHAISPTHFYIQPKVNSQNMDVVSKALAKSAVEQLPALHMVEVGTICSAYSVEDDCYYRGCVQKVLGSDVGYEIYLLDYGNTITATSIYELPAELHALPALAWKCKLNVVPEAPVQLLNEFFAALLESHFGEIYTVESDEIVEEAGEPVHIVQLQANYKDLAEELAEAVARGDAEKAVAAPVPTLHNCTIIHVNTPASFYIQLAEDVPAVEKITDVLLDAETDFEVYTDLHVGAICAAQFPEDSAYYRAEIVQVLEEGKCEVHYLDFGNNSVTDQFRVLPAPLLNEMAYSKHCALDVNWASSYEGCAAFAQFIDSRFSETFQVEFLKTSVEPKICRLFYQDKDVANEVMQVLKSGAMSSHGLANNHVTE